MRVSARTPIVQFKTICLFVLLSRRAYQYTPQREKERERELKRFNM